MAGFKNKLGPIEVCLTRDQVNAMLTMLDTMIVGGYECSFTSVSLQLQAGISIADAAKRAGHARPDVTLRIYSHALKKNDLHCCEAVTKVMPRMPKRESG